MAPTPGGDARRHSRQPAPGAAGEVRAPEARVDKRVRRRGQRVAADLGQDLNQGKDVLADQHGPADPPGGAGRMQGTEDRRDRPVVPLQVPEPGSPQLHPHRELAGTQPEVLVADPGVGRPPHVK